jgi:hypothetical protein
MAKIMMLNNLLDFRLLIVTKLTYTSNHEAHQVKKDHILDNFLLHLLNLQVEVLHQKNVEEEVAPEEESKQIPLRKVKNLRTMN